MPKMKNVAKNEIVLHDPYSNALWGGVNGLGLENTNFYSLSLTWLMAKLLT